MSAARSPRGEASSPSPLPPSLVALSPLTHGHVYQVHPRWHVCRNTTGAAASGSGAPQHAYLPQPWQQHTGGVSLLALRCDLALAAVCFLSMPAEP